MHTQRLSKTYIIAVEVVVALLVIIFNDSFSIVMISTQMDTTIEAGTDNQSSGKKISGTEISFNETKAMNNDENNTALKGNTGDLLVTANNATIPGTSANNDTEEIVDDPPKETCDMPPCPPGEMCIQVCPESIPK